MRLIVRQQGSRRMGLPVEFPLTDGDRVPRRVRSQGIGVATTVATDSAAHGDVIVLVSNLGPIRPYTTQERIHWRVSQVGSEQRASISSISTGTMYVRFS